MQELMEELKEKVIDELMTTMDANPVIVEYVDSLTRLLSVIITWGNCKTENADLSGLLATVEQYFKNCRFNSKLHLGLGDIRMTIGMQDEILKLIAEATGKENYNPPE